MSALVISVLFAAVLGLILHFLIFRPLRFAPPLAKVVASVGPVRLPGRHPAPLRRHHPAAEEDPGRRAPHFFGDIVIPQNQLILALLVIVLAASCSGCCSGSPGSASPPGRRRRTRRAPSSSASRPTSWPAPTGCWPPSSSASSASSSRRITTLDPITCPAPHRPRARRRAPRQLHVVRHHGAAGVRHRHAAGAHPSYSAPSTGSRAGRSRPGRGRVAAVPRHRHRCCSSRGKSLPERGTIGVGPTAVRADAAACADPLGGPALALATASRAVRPRLRLARRPSSTRSSAP